MSAGACDEALRAALTVRLTAELPGLLVADPAAVRIALAVEADVLGQTLGLAKLALSGEAYAELVLDTMMRADRVARARAAAAVRDGQAAAAAAFGRVS